MGVIYNISRDFFNTAAKHILKRFTTYKQLTVIVFNENHGYFLERFLQKQSCNLKDRHLPYIHLLHNDLQMQYIARVTNLLNKHYSIKNSLYFATNISCNDETYKQYFTDLATEYRKILYSFTAPIIVVGMCDNTVLLREILQLSYTEILLYNILKHRLEEYLKPLQNLVLFNDCYTIAQISNDLHIQNPEDETSHLFLQQEHINITLFTCDSFVREATLITTLITKYYPDIALVTYNYALMQQVDTLLRAHKIDIQIPQQLRDHSVIRAMLLLLEVISNDWQGMDVLALLHCPLLKIPYSERCLFKLAHILKEHTWHYYSTVELLRDISCTDLKDLWCFLQHSLSPLQKNTFTDNCELLNTHIECATKLLKINPLLDKTMKGFLERLQHALQESEFTNLSTYKAILEYFLEKEFFVTNERRVFFPHEISDLPFNKVIIADLHDENWQEDIIQKNCFLLKQDDLSKLLYRAKVFLTCNNEVHKPSSLVAKLQVFCKPDNYKGEIILTSKSNDVPTIWIPDLLPMQLTTHMLDLLLNDLAKFYTQYVLNIAPRSTKYTFARLWERILTQYRSLNTRTYQALLDLGANELDKLPAIYAKIKVLWQQKFLTLANHFHAYECTTCREYNKCFTWTIHGVTLIAHCNAITYLSDNYITITEYSLFSVSFQKLLIIGVIVSQALKCEIKALIHCQITPRGIKQNIMQGHRLAMQMQEYYKKISGYLTK